jgi:APA family basic amino acid/polyamine antiporter
MFGGTLLVIAIYLVVNLAYVHVLPMSKLAGEPLAAGAVARAIFGEHGDTTIRILAIISLLSTVNAYTLTAPRILYAMSCDDLFHHQAARVNKGGTPTVTLLISTLVAVLFIVSARFSAILAALAFFFVANYSMGYLSVIILRRREPDLPRPYRVWGYPWTTLILLLGSIAFLVGAIIADKKNSLWALGILAASYPLYLVSKFLSPRESR